MLNMLIVDDHPIERETVAYLVQQNNLPIKSYLAANGREALEYIQNNTIDILFTDIKMPKIDGLTLIDRTIQFAPKTKIIIFSGYGEFEYAQKAIHYGVQEYIMKPLRKDVFIETMKRIIKDCEAEREQERYSIQKSISDVLHGKDIDSLPVNYRTMLDNYISSQIGCMMLCIFSESFFDRHEQLFTDSFYSFINGNGIYINLSEWESILVLFSDNKSNAVRDMLIQFTHKIYLDEKMKNIINEAYFLISDTFQSYKEMAASYKKLKKVSELRFYFDNGIILLNEFLEKKSEIPAKEVERVYSRIMEGIEAGTWMTVKIDTSILFDLYNMYAYKETSVIKSICIDIAAAILRDDKEARVKIIKSIQKVKTLKELKDIINNGIEDISSKRTEKVGLINDYIQQIKNFIRENLCKDIGLTDLVEHIHLAPNYISNLFSQKEGISITEYITYQRMHIAEELIRTTGLKVKDVANNVGYTNISYFCKLFKSYYGSTPTQYREMK